MTIVTYPIILHPETIGGYSVEVPDIAGGSWTQGETVGEAIAMAQDLIGTVLQNEEEFPEPTPITNLELREDDFSAFANVDLGEFRKTHATTDQPET
ncbi:type II toxin-antitoxin system HicB family antitoxin [Lacticaseibacillus sharpeae]|uniref:HicB-like antitoxin of toxin-antitoxin system domain-containing protein n=1 Tax=Lacticaseibacillus sharpeae JCM 1186 = DSM 20505 TaxID=1291052 RepID=A0A0R1ZJC8_9LACO|nr:type II toxin-antitoxin system HicB family antitoxin [Lacticaseibacillus sharpeae]KRM55073.1 hypothetical protein FC18_GL001670 [Lacticaseibacillus sharpeae JCM 1186 = DSM 20505]